MLDRILFSVVLIFNRCDTLLGTNISYPPQKGTFKDVVPFPQVGYVSSLQNRILCTLLLLMEEILHHLGCIKPRKTMGETTYQVCRISAINSSFLLPCHSAVKRLNDFVEKSRKNRHCRMSLTLR